MAKINYDNFNSFDLNEACDHFDVEDQKQWNKINDFILADGQEYTEVMEAEFGFEDTSDTEYAAFEAGIKYALSKLNVAFKRAGLPLEVQEVDLVEAGGFALTRAKDTPESFINRVLKKPAVKVQSWA
jgi:hypothetical protein